MVIFSQSMKRIFKNKIRLFLLLIMPVIFIALFALQDERSLTIGIVDKDNSSLSQRLVDDLAKMDKVKIISEDESELYDKAASYQNDYALIIKKGFEKEILSGKSPEIREFYISDKEKLFYARNHVENFVNDMKMMASGAGYDAAKFKNELKNYDNSKLSIKDDKKVDNITHQSRAAAGFLIQFMIYMSVITAGILLEDKNNGVFYRTFTAPVTLKRYLGENLAAFLTVGIAQVILILGLSQAVFKINFGSNPINIYMLFIVFALVCVSLGMWIISMFKKPIGAYAAILTITTPLVMLGGCYWPMSFMPDIFQKIARFLPTTWAMDGAEKIILGGKSITEIWLQILVLLIFSGIFLAAGIVRKVDISK